MKKFIAISTLAFSLLLNPLQVFAAADSLNVSPPPNTGITANTSTVLSSAVKIIFIIAGVAVLFMLMAGAFQWITSGGDKEAVEKARKRIIAAMIGLAILALSLVIVRVLGQILNINILGGGDIPSLNGT